MGSIKQYVRIRIMESKKKVLIVDDEPQIGKIFGLKLKLSGFEVVSTVSGAEAIDLVRNQNFDIMLLDVLMPDVTGMDVLDSVRSFSQIPIILFTARPDVFEIAKRFGATDYISKPLNPESLLEKIKSILAKSEKPA
jgi:DNA-binding response OmpR family regulator